MGEKEKNTRANRRRRAGLIRWIYAACMLSASLIHFHDIVNGGMLPYRFAPMALNVYWTALAFIDLAAVVLLTALPRLGVVVAAVVIFTNIPINAYATITVFKSGLFSHWQTLGQLLFGLFVLATMTYVFKYLKREDDAVWKWLTIKAGVMNQ